MANILDSLKKLMSSAQKTVVPVNQNMAQNIGGGALSRLLNQPQAQQQQMPPGMATGGYPQAIYNDAAGINYPGTLHAEQDTNTGNLAGRPGDINFYANPNGMYNRPQGSMPNLDQLSRFYRNNNF